MKTSLNEPISPISGDGAIAIGLTKREYFAIMILQGFSANSSTYNKKSFIKIAIDMADILIEELDKEPEDETY